MTDLHTTSRAQWRDTTPVSLPPIAPITFRRPADAESYDWPEPEVVKWPGWTRFALLLLAASILPVLVWSVA